MFFIRGVVGICLAGWLSFGSANDVFLSCQSVNPSFSSGVFSPVVIDQVYADVSPPDDYMSATGGVADDRRWWVQLMASSSENALGALQSRLLVPTVVVDVPTAGFKAVQVGGYQSEGEARSALADFRAGYADAFLVYR